MTNYIKTAEKIQVKDYPYGFKLRTTLTDSMEFDPRRGYRHVTQTVNPKTGRDNKPKKGTYYPLLVRYYNQDGHIKTVAFDFNGDEAINKGCKFLAENFDLFTPEEIKYMYTDMYSMSLVDMKATVIYGGSNIEDLKPLYETFRSLCKQGIETGENLFGSMYLDSEAINKTKPANYNPFKTTSHGS
jgi:hypothetical protein